MTAIATDQCGLIEFIRMTIYSQFHDIPTHGAHIHDWIIVTDFHRCKIAANFSKARIEDMQFTGGIINLPNSKVLCGAKLNYYLIIYC